MNVPETYQKIVSELEQGHRALIRLKADELEQLDQAFTTSFQDITELEKILCIVDHVASLNLKFSANILRALMLDLPDRLIIFALNCSRKHIVEANFQKGNRLNYEYLEALKKHLNSKSPEVVEWTLRTIEECGNQGVYFLREFDKIKPAPWKWFNPHQRAVRELIALLERRWRR